MVPWLPLLFALAQQDKLPPATPLPPPASEEGQIMVPIKAVLAAISARDSAAIATQLRPDGNAVAVIEKPDGTRTIKRFGWAEWTGGVKPGPERIEERLSDPAIEIDGDLAMVWSPYVFLIDGKVHHCGVDHFDLIREGGGWKIANLSWTSRTTGCPTP